MSIVVDQGLSLASAWGASCLDVPLARSQAQAALERSVGGSREAAWAFWLRALAEARAQDPQAARTRLQPARLLFLQYGDARGQRMSDELEAAIALHAGDAPRAREIQLSIDERADNQGEPGALDQALFNLWRSQAERRLGHHAQALDHAEAALPAARLSGNGGLLAEVLNLLGALAFDRLELEAARRHLEEALQLARDCGARQLVTSSAAQLIVTHHAAGRPAWALDMADFLVEHPQLQAPAALMRVAVPIALAYWADDDIDRAEAWLEGGSTVHAVDGDNIVFWAWLSTRCLLARGENRLARDLAERTWRARPSGEPPYHPMLLSLAAADACDALGDRTAAHEHRQQAQALREQMGRRAAAPAPLADGIAAVGA